MQNDIILIGTKLLKHTNNNDKNYFYQRLEKCNLLNFFWI